jgi:hypothetical protein
LASTPNIPIDDFGGLPQTLQEISKKTVFSLEDEGTTIFRNVGNHLPTYTALHPIINQPAATT